MSRIGGRSPWVAWPIGILCLGIIIALVVLASPIVPVGIEWIGSVLRGS